MEFIFAHHFTLSASFFAFDPIDQGKSWIYKGLGLSRGTGSRCISARLVQWPCTLQWGNSDNFAAAEWKVKTMESRWLVSRSLK